MVGVKEADFDDITFESHDNTRVGSNNNDTGAERLIIIVLFV